MDLQTSHLLQLLIAAGCGIIIFTFVNLGYQRLFYTFLLTIIPFQFIDSKYGTLNMALVYVLGVSMLFNKSWDKKKYAEKLPLIAPIVIIIMSALISWIFAPGVFFNKTFYYMIMFGSNIVMFYISYNLVLDNDDILIFFKAFVICNALVILYCVLQMFAGFGVISIFGVQEFTIHTNRLDQRLVGPFNAVGITAEYFVVQNILLAYSIIVSKRYRKTFITLICFNLAAMIGTGNRGGIVCTIISSFMLGYLFRKELGLKRLIVMTIVSFMAFIIVSFVMIKYTDFNVIYDRLLGTEMHGITPDTRKGWPFVIERIMDKPFIGHGPRLIVKTDFVNSRIVWPVREIGFWPHSLYLTTLYSTGFIGFFAWLNLCVCYIIRLLREKRQSSEHLDSIAGLPKLAIIILTVVLIDQMKVEMTRASLLDYQHYISGLFGLFLGLPKLRLNS